MKGVDNPNYGNKQNRCLDCGKAIGYIRKTRRCWSCHVVHNRGKNHPAWKGGNKYIPKPIERKKYLCVKCNAPTKKGRKYCVECRLERKATKINLSCKQCKKVFSIYKNYLKHDNRVFCSNGCRYKYLSKPCNNSKTSEKWVKTHIVK